MLAPFYGSFFSLAFCFQSPTRGRKSLESHMAKSQKQAKKSPVVKGQARPFCQNGPRVLPQLSPAVMAHTLVDGEISSSRSKWVNGTVLHYCFFTSGHFEVPRAQADAVRKAFAKWK